MTTLKLSKKPTEKTSVSAKKPVRRADPANRSRTSAPAKTVVRPAEQTSRDQPSSTSRSKAFEDKPRRDSSHQPKQDFRPRGNNVPSGNEQTAQSAVAPRQRNHRFDGTPREPKGPDSRAPAERVVERGEFKRDEFVRTPRASTPRDATGRDTPRRGGKQRDGFEQGAFNNDRASNPKFAPKPVAGNPDLPRLSKRMAELGLCSRREADEWIVNSWVKVDGVIVDTLGARVRPDAEIVISGYAKEHQAESVTILLNKPVGYVSGQAEDGYQPAIVLVHPDNQWEDDPELHQKNPKVFSRSYLQGLAPAGRLDIDSTGLLVLTQDGRIARHLIGQDSTIEKEYLVRVQGTLSEAGLKKLNFGLSLDGVELKPAKVSWQNEDQLRFVLREGRKRQIRRMCEMVGLEVIGLKRIRIGSVTLGKLPVGSWRYLRMNEKF